MKKEPSYTITTRFNDTMYRNILKSAYKYDLKPSQVIKIICGVYYENEKRSLRDLSEPITSSRNKGTGDL